MKKESVNSHRPLAILAALFTFMFAFVGSFSLFDGNTALVLGGSFLLSYFVFLLFEAADGMEEENIGLQNTLAKVTATLIIGSLVFATWFSIQSLWIEPFDQFRNKFVLENIATGATIAAAILTLILSTLQRDVYWMTKRKPGILDERQVKDRQDAFERSYKFGAVLAIITLWGYLSSVDSIGRIKEIAVSPDALPGHYFVPAYCLAIALFALPLIIAAWKKS